DMTPSDRRDMKGMMANVAPHAACAPMEKRIMERMDRVRVSARPRQMQKIPPRVWRIQRVHNRPLIPKRRAAMSDIKPPKGRDTMFGMPKVAAMVPAVCNLRLNLNVKKLYRIWLSITNKYVLRQLRKLRFCH